ncbi:MAG: DUF2383 domain-containing protein [Deltaproteobacteria bacterium]|nr:DUF2383 domain-containing protein [Deltaproteobacteria bacterium]
MARLDESIETLNSFLRGEPSAIETYGQALVKVTDPGVRLQLEECRRSHSERARKIRNRIMELGGAPAETSGVWGAFAKVVEGGAALLGEKAAIAALEEGEDRGLKDYREDSGRLDPASRELVFGELLPQQERTHGAMSTLKHSVQ